MIAFWMRILGVGVHIKDVRRHRLMFSERYGRASCFRIKCWQIKYLPKRKF